MLISEEKVNRVIALAARRSAAYEEFTSLYRPDRIHKLGDETDKDSEEYQLYEKTNAELKNVLLKLNYQEILDLEALMLLGRGEGDDFDSCRKYFGSLYPNENIKLAVQYLVSKGPLDQYLADGLSQI